MSLHTTLKVSIVNKSLYSSQLHIDLFKSAAYKPLVSSRLHDSGAFGVVIERFIAFASRFLCCLLFDIDLFHVSST